MIRSNFTPASGSAARKKSFLSFKTKMLLYFGLAFSAGLLTIGSAMFYGIPFTDFTGQYRMIQSEVFKDLNLLAEVQKAELMHFIQERRVDVKAFTENTLSKKQIVYLSSLIEEKTTQGLRQGDQLISAITKEDTYRSLVRNLNTLQKSYESHASMQLVDAKTGLIMATDTGKDLGVDMRTDADFLKVIAPGQDEVITVIRDRKRNNIYLAMYFAVKDFNRRGEDKKRAVLVLRIKPDAFLKPLLFQGKEIGKTGEIVMVDQDGLLLMPLRHTLPDGTSPKPFEFSVNDAATVLAAGGNEGIMATVDYRSVPVLAAYRHVLVNAETAWGIVIKMDQAEAFAPLWHLMSYIAVLALLTCLITLGLIYGIAGKLSRPIRLLSLTARKVEEGDLTARAPVYGSDEVGILSDSFNSMVERIQNWHSELEEQVRTRTSQWMTVNENLNKEIEEHKRTEAALSESETKFRSLFTAMTEGTALHELIIDEKGKAIDYRIVDANPAYEKHTGLSAKGSKNQLASTFYGTDTPPYLDIYANVAQTGEPHFFETYFLSLNKYFEISVFSPKPGWFATIFTDISERMKAEAALYFAEKKFRDILERIHLVAIILDTDGKVTFCNDYFLRLTGWTRDDTLGRNWFDRFLPMDVKDNVKCVFTKAISDGTIPEHYENPIITRDNSARLIVWDSTLLFNAEGKVAGTASIGIDVTEQRKLEEQLLQSQKMEAIGQLAGGVAHDFNNILSAIVGYAHLTLMKLTEDNGVRGHQEQILAASGRAATLVQSLLSFSRKQVINPKAVNLNDIVIRLEKMLQRLIREDIDIATSCTDVELRVFADSSQIEQLLMNLITNARDAMPEGGHISIQTEAILLNQSFIDAHGYGKPETYALLSVSDTGEGMDAKIKERIFEPFFTTKEQGKGTGLGLSMVYGTVKQHDGYIDVYSEPGEGTTFKIYLPLMKEPAQDDMEKAVNVSIQGGSETILVAEDDATLRELTSTILRNCGYQVIEAVDGEDAITKYTENRNVINLVILDAIMPKKNGKEAYRKMRSLNPAVKTIFVSGYAEDIMNRQGLLESGINFIGKPITPSILLKKVREMLDA